MAKSPPKTKKPKTVKKAVGLSSAVASAPKKSHVPPATPEPKPAKSGFAAGQRVSLSSFGPGVIESIDGHKLEIKFKTAGVKWIIDSFVKSA